MRRRLPDHKGQGCAGCVGQLQPMRLGLLRPRTVRGGSVTVSARRGLKRKIIAGG